MRNESLGSSFRKNPTITFKMYLLETSVVSSNIKYSIQLSPSLSLTNVIVSLYNVGTQFFRRVDSSGVGCFVYLKKKLENVGLSSSFKGIFAFAKRRCKFHVIFLSLVRN